MVDESRNVALLGCIDNDIVVNLEHVATYSFRVVADLTQICHLLTNFLANVFRKSLEEQGGVQNLNDLLASIIPNVQMPGGHQGSVVDLGVCPDGCPAGKVVSFMMTAVGDSSLNYFQDSNPCRESISSPFRLYKLC